MLLLTYLTETCYCLQLYGNCRIMQWIGKSLLFIPSFQLIIDHCVLHWAVIAFLFDFSASRKKVSFLITKWALGTIFTLRYLQTPLPWQPELFPLANGVSQCLNNRGSFMTVDTEIKQANGVCFILNIRKLSFRNVKSSIADPIYQNSTVSR